MSTAPIVFLEQEYSYRNWWIGAFFLIFGSGTGLMMVGLAAWLGNFPPKFAAGQAAWWEPLAMLAWVTPFVGMTVYTAWLFIWRPRWLVRIDDRGITFGHQFFGWDRVAWIGVRPVGQVLHWRLGYYPSFHLKSRWPFALDRGLPLSPTLTTEQAEEMLDRLEEFLSETFPDVEVG